MDVAKGVLPNLRQQILVLSEAARAMWRYDAASELSPTISDCLCFVKIFTFQNLDKIRVVRKI
jgi:hypothetical protein